MKVQLTVRNELVVNDWKREKWLLGVGVILILSIRESSLCKISGLLLHPTPWDSLEYQALARRQPWSQKSWLLFLCLLLHGNSWLWLIETSPSTHAFTITNPRPHIKYLSKIKETSHWKLYEDPCWSLNSWIKCFSYLSVNMDQYE